MPSGTSLCLQEAQIRLETKDTSRNKTKKKRLGQTDKDVEAQAA